MISEAPTKEVALAIILRNKQILLVKRRKQEIGKDGKKLAWGLPGGKIEPGESVEEAAVRETYEETGYRVHSNKRLSERIHPDFPVKSYYCLCELLLETAEEVHDRATEEVHWVSITEIGEYISSELDPAVKRVLKVAE